MTELAYPSGLSQSRAVVSLQSLVDQLQPVEVQRFRHLGVEALACNSDEVVPGSLFFAIRGVRKDGATYATQALNRGALAVVSEQRLNLPCPVLVVSNARRALADAAAAYYGHTSGRMPVVGVTGTNGKTTVSHLIRGCLEATGRRVGMIGTNGYQFGGRTVPMANTTPDPLRVQGYLREMADRQANACVMEVSSHALTQDRVRGVKFRVGVFLNLTQDHLDYHATLKRYAEAKAELFRSMYPGSVACLNADSDASTIMQEALDPGIRVRKFGIKGDAEVRAEDLQCTLEGTRFVLCMPKGRVELMLRLPGAHNVQNALAAVSACLALSVSELTIASALEQARPVAGRLERVGDNEDIRVFVDYAHTPDALEQVCSTLSELTAGRLLTVFGCGGDRDPTKRPLMTMAVGHHADVAYMTSDNPRSEDPESILDDMEAEIGDDGCAFYRVVDRATAIQRAVLQAEPGDTVLIAGKGHESYQILRDSVIPFEDRLAAEEALQLRGLPA